MNPTEFQAIAKVEALRREAELEPKHPKVGLHRLAVVSVRAAARLEASANLPAEIRRFQR